MKEKINGIVMLGYSYEDSRKIILALPSIFGLNIDTIREKKEFYDMIGLSDVFIVKPKYLIQSVELSYARYMFYKDRGIDIDMSNYSILFISRGNFYNKYKIDKIDILELYNYNRDCVLSKKKVI